MFSSIITKSRQLSCYTIAGIQAMGQSHKLGSGVSNTPPATNMRSWCLTASMTAFQADGPGSNPGGRSNFSPFKHNGSALVL